MSQAEFRNYKRDQVVSFRKTTEDFGGLSNMAPGFPIAMLGHRIKTSEALYQACRFPHMPEIQRMVIEEASPMTAKMRSKPFRKDSRADWEDVRVSVMRWCLRAKLLQNWPTFSALLIETGDRPIVENSRKDDYWGAKADDDDQLAGRNVLGRLLMELREIVRSKPERLVELPPLDIPDFLLMGRAIPPLSRAKDNSNDSTMKDKDATKPASTPSIEIPAKSSQGSLL